MYYLFGSLFVALLFVGLLLLRPDLKRQGLIPALIFSPYGPISELIYFRDYWLPEPVLPPMALFGQSFLTEDLIFAFGIVGLMSVAYDVVRFKHPTEGIYPRRVWPAVGLSLVAMGLFVGLSLATRFNSIVVGAVVAVGCAVPMITLRRDLLPVAVGSSLIIGLATFCFYVGILTLPGATDYLTRVWKLPVEQLALRVFGIPVPSTEVMWAFATTVYYSIIYKFAAGSGYRP